MYVLLAYCVKAELQWLSPKASLLFAHNPKAEERRIYHAVYVEAIMADA